jgi:hypothetical protein
MLDINLPTFGLSDHSLQISASRQQPERLEFASTFEQIHDSGPRERIIVLREDSRGRRRAQATSISSKSRTLVRQRSQ